MGLDANVMCNCWRLGLTTAPPFPRHYLETDVEGYLHLCAEFDDDALWVEFFAWTLTCCSHKGMRYADEFISNWTGYRLFQEAIARVGSNLFPVLAAELPSSNGGQTTSAQSKLALAELERFKTISSLGKNASLVDQSGYVIFEHVAAYEGLFVLDGRPGGVRIGMGEFEFFIKDGVTNATLFRAKRVRQTLLDHRDENRQYEGRVEFLDLDTGLAYVTTTTVSGRSIPWPDGRMENDQGQVKNEHPIEFRVVIEERDPGSFDYIVQPLLRIFAASVETGNPVRWS